MADFDELCEYWAEHPPAHILLAGFVGYKAQKASLTIEQLIAGQG